MIRGQKTRDRGQMVVCRTAALIIRLRGKAATKPLSSGFTLVEMIVVIVITGIIGGMVAVFLKAPIQQYMDVARRADMTDIADTALRRIGRDLRLALPNSVRVTGVCDGVAACFIEFLPTTGGGRYRAALADAAPFGDMLDFGVPDQTFDVFGAMPAFAVGDSIVIYNMTADPADPNPNAYVGGNRAACAAGANSCSAGANPVTLAAATSFPHSSCQTDPVTGRTVGCRFHVISTPATYACDGAGTLWRYWGYAIQAAQPATVATLNGLAGVQLAKLATNISSCRFSYDGNVVAQRSGLVTMNLGITENNETVTLYSATHVSNQP